MSAASGEGGPLRRWRGAGMVSLEMLDRPESFSPGSVMNARRHAERFRCLYVSTVIPLGRKRPRFDERDIPQSHRRSRSFFRVSMVNAGSPARRSSPTEMQDECHADPHPYPGHNLRRYSCHPGLAVLRRCGQTNHRELVPAAWLVGAAGRTNWVQRSRHDRLGGASCPFSRSQRLNAISLDLDAIRQSVDRIAITQEQITRNVDQLTARQERMTRNVDQLAAGQERMTREINKLQAVEQQTNAGPALARNSRPRQGATPMRR